MTKIKKLNELNDIPENLDKDRLYASGENSFPGERLRNFLSPIFTYFHIVQDESLDKETKEKILKSMENQCVDSLEYIRYWLHKVK